MSTRCRISPCADVPTARPLCQSVCPLPRFCPLLDNPRLPRGCGRKTCPPLQRTTSQHTFPAAEPQRLTHNQKRNYRTRRGLRRWRRRRNGRQSCIVAMYTLNYGASMVCVVIDGLVNEGREVRHGSLGRTFDVRIDRSWRLERQLARLDPAPAVGHRELDDEQKGAGPQAQALLELLVLGVTGRICHARCRGCGSDERRRACGRQR